MFEAESNHSARGGQVRLPPTPGYRECVASARPMFSSFLIKHKTKFIGKQENPVRNVEDYIGRRDEHEEAARRRQEYERSENCK